ncbi:MAG: hypothetical protein LBK61_05215 [Spirochaetaceae bacterium]|nr:hypothetical protein [Spirochaetaceae bacterium]
MADICKEYFYEGWGAPADCPAGGENPQGFHPCVSHPCVKPIPDSGRKSSGMAGRASLVAECPCRGRKLAGVSSLRGTSPRSGRKSSGMAGISPPYGGCASPAGAQCRHKGVLCLPRRCRIGEG